MYKGICFSGNSDTNIWECAENVSTQRAWRKNNKLLRTETRDGRKCWVVESVPVDKREIYSRKVTWVAQDYDDIRIPVNAIHLRHTRPQWSAEAIVVPVSSFYELSTDGRNPWAVSLPGVTMPYSIDMGETPRKRLKNMEYGEVQEPAAGKEVETRNSTSTLIGADLYAGNDWQLGVQYSHKYISGDLSDISSCRNSGMATVRISKDLLRSTLNIATFAYVDVTKGGVYNRLSADYALTDQIHTLLGYDLFHADRGQFAMYGRNSEAWIKLKYSF